MLNFRRANAIEYVLMFVAFWAVSLIAVLTRSNELRCGPDGCPVSPVHPVLLVAGLGLSVGMCVQGWRQALRERHRILPDGGPRVSLLPGPVPTTVARWSLVTSVMLFGLAIPSAVRAVRGSPR